MGGKAAILLVAGFSIIFMVLGNNANNLSVRSVDNVYKYYYMSKAHSIASAGANIAASKIFFDNSWRAGFSEIEYDGGLYNVDIEVLDPIRNVVLITSVGEYGTGSDKQYHSVEVKLQPSSFSRFAYFSENEKTGSSTIWWTTQDTVWGPFHTNDRMSIDGDPVFMGKATSHGGRYMTRDSDPEFNGGYEETEEPLPIPTDGVDQLADAAADDGLYIENDDGTKDTVYLTFKGDSLGIKYSYSETETIVKTSEAAPNGTIFVEGGDIRMKGTVSGQYSVGTKEQEITTTTTTGYWKWDRRRRRYVWAESTTTTTTIAGGQVWLDDDIVYNDDPTDGNFGNHTYHMNGLVGSSTDLLGIVAEKEIWITDNAANRNDINIHAALYSETKGFGAENYDSRSVSGNINLLGGITQNSRMAVGTFSGSTTISGFNKRYYYDNRLMVMSPPFFPGTGNFEVVSWYE
ncbi:MAG: DUF4900 domain-containing protein [Melioribacteraceae bacterium]|nr:DUF4900 domain-containing protein [Melioribacteraceae bacterium]MDD3558500.1 DUF4900 domain-containing protein [Melioribacteraceae bacterium]